MDDFPSNSHRTPKTERAKRVVEVEVEETKTVERTATGNVIRRKKPLGKRITENLFGGHAKGVGEYVFRDVLLPAARDTIADMVTQGIERTVYGEARSTSRRTGRGPGGRTNYQGFSQGAHPAMRNETREMSRRNRANFNFEEVVLTTRSEAVGTLNQMDDMIERYGSCAVKDLYNMVGITPEFTDGGYGWYDMGDATVQRVRDGYLLDLPRPEPIR